MQQMGLRPVYVRQMDMRRIETDQVAPRAWRNGGGRTRELLAYPGAHDWTFRVSLADIDADGPFSSFPGVQRWFVVVQGGGVRLTFAEGEQFVRPGGAPLRFDGAAAPDCHLIDGSTRDLNLMIRSGRGTMQPVRAGEPWLEHFDQRGLFTAHAGRCVLGTRSAGAETQEAPAVALGAHTLLWYLGDESCRFMPDRDATPCGWWLGWTHA